MKQHFATPRTSRVSRSCHSPQRGTPSDRPVEVVSPTGRPILGTLERASARWPVTFSADPEGQLSYEHDGREPHFFKEQLRTVRRGGQAVFLDDQGSEWLLPQLTVKDPPASTRPARKTAGRLAAGG